MIQVRNLTKYYDDYPAVQDVSFEVEEGKVVGFLGPNGAGKTTTMRILAGYLTATSGQALIDGIDVFWDPVAVRRRIGYLPENCPLYPDMRVIEYLRFRAGIKGIYGARRRERIDYVTERCWLTSVRRQLIGTLSKGYRQRVGLADALLADPPVLILDEPTVGLDPTQIRSTRQLIRDLGKQHTILLSTHILPEVEMTCSHVIIIDRGTIVAAGSLEELARQAGEQQSLLIRLRGEVDTERIRSAIEDGRHLSIEATDGEIQVRVATDDADTTAIQVSRLAVEHGWEILELRHDRQTLEDLFVRLTSASRAEQEALSPSAEVA